MSSETQSIRQRLATYLAQLPPPAVLKLASGLEREKLRGTTGLPYEMILSGLRPLLASLRGARPGKPDPLRQFCRPFEDLLVDGDDDGRRQGSVARGTVMRVWAWLEEELLPDALPDLTKRIVDHTLKGDSVALEAAVSVLHASAAQAILTATDAARSNAERRKQLEQRLGGEAGMEDAREIGAVLSIAAPMLALQAELPKRIDNFTDDMVTALRDAYIETSETSPSEALYLPFMVMNRLEEPSQILRFVRKVAHQRNDAVISRSELAVFGETLLAEMDEIARRVHARRAGQADLEPMLEDVRRFAQLSRGFASEIDLHRNSEWGQRVLAGRARVSAAVAQEMSRFETELIRALPFHQIGQYGRGGPMKPDLAKGPDRTREERMRACLRFVSGMTPICESLGAQSHCRSVRQQIEAYLGAYEDRLLEELRLAQGSARVNAEDFLETVAGFYEALDESGQADVLRRRGRVAIGG